MHWLPKKTYSIIVQSHRYLPEIVVSLNSMLSKFFCPFISFQLILLSLDVSPNFTPGIIELLLYFLWFKLKYERGQNLKYRLKSLYFPVESYTLLYSAVILIFVPAIQRRNKSQITLSLSELSLIFLLVPQELQTSYCSTIALHIACFHNPISISSLLVISYNSSSTAWVSIDTLVNTFFFVLEYSF